MTPPSNTKLYEDELMTYWFDTDGILNGLTKNAKRTVDNVKTDFDLVRQITNGKPVPMMFYMGEYPIPDKITSEFADKELPAICSAMAIMSESGLKNFMMLFVFTLMKNPIPKKAFFNDRQAKIWLRQYL